MNERRGMRPETRTLLICLFLCTFAVAAVAQPAGPPRVSPMATTSQVVGLAEVEITYSRPFVKERTIWGELVPYGEVWRTGANEATTFEISHDAKIDGKALAAGEYALFTIPGESSWTLIFNNEAEQWGAFQHDPEKDALRVEVKPESAPHAEMFTIGFSDVDSDSARVNLHWKDVNVPFVVEFDTPEIAIEQARKDAEDAENNARQLYGWAGYFHQEEAHLDEALEWADAVTEQTENFFTLSLKARLQAANGKTEAALATAEKALELGEQSQANNPNPAVQSAIDAFKEEMEEWGE